MVKFLKTVNLLVKLLSPVNIVRVLIVAASSWVLAVNSSENSLAHSDDFKAFTFNLHGYHPYKEPLRYLENRRGELELVRSHLHYFSPQELSRGHAKQIKVLGEFLQERRPHVVFLQEVGGGFARPNMNCSDFENRPKNESRNESRNEQQTYTGLGRNSAQVLQQDLSDYALHLACRGNVGWRTFRDTYNQQRVVRLDANGHRHVVHDFGSNPYPHGVLVEGTALLVHPDWQAIHHESLHLSINTFGDRFFVQIAALQKKSEQTQAPNQNPRSCMIVANLHAGHKLVHFEQAVALRRYLSEYYQRHRNACGRLQGTLIGGDFNARLYRPNAENGEGSGEIASVPWEVQADGEFDFGLRSREHIQQHLEMSLTEGLWDLNFNLDYKPWATIHSRSQVTQRIQRAVNGFYDWQQSMLRNGWGHQHIQLREGFLSAVEKASAETPDRIDFFFAPQGWTSRWASMFFENSDWWSLEGLSDHPALEVHYSF